MGCEGSYILLDPFLQLLVRPRHRRLGIVNDGRLPGKQDTQRLSIPQRVPAGPNIRQRRVHARNDDRLARAMRRRVQDVLEDLGQRALAPRDMRLALAGGDGGVGLGLAADAVLEHRQAGVDLARLLDARAAVRRRVARRLGARQVDHVQHAVLGRRARRVLEADAADGVRARRRVALVGGFGAAERGRRLDEAEHLGRRVDAVLHGAVELRGAEGVLHHRYGSTLVEEVWFVS